MNNEVIACILGSAIRSLFKKQPDVLKSTRETTMTEWNFGHHLANQIARYVFWLDVDVDLGKRNYENRRPDIICHKRTINALNYLVIEIKVDSSPHADIQKIRADWMQPNLNYRFGISVSVSRDKSYRIEVFERGNAGSLIVNETCASLPIPTKKGKVHIKKLVEKIEQKEKEHGIGACSELLAELDREIAALF